MSWAERAWKAGFYTVLLTTTWLLLRPQVPAGVPPIPGLDKLIHVVMFAALAILAARAYADRPRWGIFAALVFYGVCIEMAQGRVGRTPEALDVLADAAGAAVVYATPRARTPPAPRDA